MKSLAQILVNGSFLPGRLGAIGAHCAMGAMTGICWSSSNYLAARSRCWRRANHCYFAGDGWESFGEGSPTRASRGMAWWWGSQVISFFGGELIAPKIGRASCRERV